MSVNKTDIEDFEAALKEFELSHLKRLQKCLATEIQWRQDHAISDAIMQIHKIAATVGMKADDLLSIKPAKTQSATPAPVKFRHPTNLNLKWSGRGRKPLWIEQFLSSDKTKSINDLAVQH